jgi:hypothetical protein
MPGNLLDAATAAFVARPQKSPGQTIEVVISWQGDYAARGAVDVVLDSGKYHRMEAYLAVYKEEHNHDIQIVDGTIEVGRAFLGAGSDPTVDPDWADATTVRPGDTWSLTEQVTPCTHIVFTQLYRGTWEGMGLTVAEDLERTLWRVRVIATDPAVAPTFRFDVGMSGACSYLVLGS